MMSFRPDDEKKKRLLRRGGMDAGEVPSFEGKKKDAHQRAVTTRGTREDGKIFLLLRGGEPIPTDERNEKRYDRRSFLSKGKEGKERSTKPTE